MTHHYDSSASGYLSDSFEGTAGQILCVLICKHGKWTFGRGRLDVKQNFFSWLGNRVKTGNVKN